MSSIRKVFKVMKFSGMKEHYYLFFCFICYALKNHKMDTYYIAWKEMNYLKKYLPFFYIFFNNQYYNKKKEKFVVTNICPGTELTWVPTRVWWSTFFKWPSTFSYLKKVDNRPWVGTQVTTAFLVNKCQLYFQCCVYICLNKSWNTSFQAKRT